MKKSSPKKRPTLIIGVIICICLCLLEVILYASGIKEKYAYLIFAIIFVVLLACDIIAYIKTK